MAKTGREEALVIGSLYGTEAEKYKWQIIVEKIPDPTDNEEETVDFMNVQIKVQWGDNEDTNRVVELNTVKTVSPL